MHSPHKFILSKNNQYLFYYGGSHIYQPDHPMFGDIEEYWNSFTLKIKSSKYLPIALIEGGVRPIYPTKEESIKKDGEAGFLTYIANKSNIKVDSPEPPHKLIDKLLMRKFSKEEIEYYYFAQIVSQHLSMNIDKNIEDYINNFLAYDKRESDWKNFEFTINNMKKIHQKLFGGKINIFDKDFFYKIINPTLEGTIINEIAKVVSKERDKLIAKKIVETWKNKHNIFVLYSFYHAYQQEPTLRKLIK